MLRVGLTGNIAAGKSTVAGRFAASGAVVIDADRLGHELIGPAGAATATVVALFGPEVRGADGGVDRGKLGPLAFADAGSLERLNAIVHPLLIAEVRRRVEGLASGEARENEDGSPVVPMIAVVDAALLFELGMAGEFDRTVVVSAPEEVRRWRLAERGLKEEETRRRIASQWPEAEKIRRADFHLVNDGTKEDLLQRADAIWIELKCLADLSRPDSR